MQHKNALDINSLNASVDKEKFLNFVDDDENNTDGERPEATRFVSLKGGHIMDSQVKPQDAIRNFGAEGVKRNEGSL